MNAERWNDEYEAKEAQNPKANHVPEHKDF